MKKVAGTKRSALTAAAAPDAAAMKGKKTAAGAYAPTVDIKKSDGDWVKSTLNVEVLVTRNYYMDSYVP